MLLFINIVYDSICCNYDMLMIKFIQIKEPIVKHFIHIVWSCGGIKGISSDPSSVEIPNWKNYQCQDYGQTYEILYLLPTWKLAGDIGEVK